ncbi:response regulator transcription factor [Nocardia sp. NPDC051052]|uniref:response regulator transcription factor n=1 Tax=Nocardia sp. NPDC051052 TaxID=3364322 RepID=UPI0037B09B90
MGGFVIKNHSVPGEDHLNRVRVVVFDAQPVTRIGIRAVLEQNAAQVIGEADDEQGLHDLIDEQEPDVAVVDPSLAYPIGPVSMVRSLFKRPNCPYVVVFSSIRSRELLLPFYLLGVCGYVSKDAQPQRLIQAIHDAAQGRQDWFIGTMENQRNGGAHMNRLSPRERDVLTLMSMRLTNAEIAKELTISLQTVKNHTSSVLRKLGLNNRTEVMGWISAPKK